MTSPSAALAPEVLLRRHYRWMRAGLPLAVASAGLLATLAALWLAHPSAAAWKHWGLLGTAWTAGLTLSGVAGLALWLARRWSLRQTAQRVDARLQSMNRLETAAQFAKIDDPLLRAQREETAAFLSKTPVQRRLRRFPWLILGICALLFGHAVTWLLWARPWVRPAATARIAAPSPPPLPQASIRWESPKPETKAAPIEEVPLEATADSTGGLRDLSLEISVNGEPKLGVPIPMDVLAKPGPHKIDTSIYLDQLEVQPYDIVSYFLRARRIAAQPDIPETVSPVQFVEVKPFRDDIREADDGQPAMSADEQSALALIKAMKVAQLRLIKENFTLANAGIGHDQPDWQEENRRVGSEQGILETKAGEVLKLMISAGSPAEMVDLITQAQPLIGDAAKKIVAGQNQPALPVQGKALADITAIEKYLINIIPRSQSGSPPPPSVTDPFEKQRDVVLKQRDQTQAGELELLAHEQTRLAEDLAKNVTQSDAPQPGATPDKNRITGAPGERQTQISQRVGALLNGQNFDPETTGHLEKGRAQAQESLRQLDAEDPEHAREPAVTAAQELQLAADAMNRAGQEKAQQQMEAALHAMNDAADQARNAPNQPSQQQSNDAAAKAAQQVGQARRDLADAAQKQQATGSESAATQLAALANALNDHDLREALQKLRDQSRDPATAQAAAQRLDALAQRMVPQPAPGGPTPEQLAALIERMDRARANLARLAQLSQSRPGPPSPQGPQGPQGPPSTPTLDAAHQEFARTLMDQIDEDTAAGARDLPDSPEVFQARQAVRSLVGTLQGQPPAAYVAAYGRLNEPVNTMLNILRAELQRTARQHLLTDQHADQAPPAYRAAVADYFERLSRDYKTAPDSKTP